jgi:hypothetical protein
LSVVSVDEHRYYVGKLDTEGNRLTRRLMTAHTSNQGKVADRLVKAKLLEAEGATFTIDIVKNGPINSETKQPYRLLAVTINTPDKVDFTTLRLAVKTDGVVEVNPDMWSFISDDTNKGSRRKPSADMWRSIGEYGLGYAGNTGWEGQDYTASINASPSFGAGFVLSLSTQKARTSPATFYILMNEASWPPTYMRAAEGMEIADGQPVSQLILPTPSLVTSIVDQRQRITLPAPSSAFKS